MKAEYIAPVAEVIEISGDDIITSSCPTDTCWADCPGDNTCWGDCGEYDPNAGINYTGEVCLN